MGDKGDVFIIPLKRSRLLERSYVFRLRTFLTLSHFESHFLTFFERSAASAVDSTEVNKYVRTTFTLNKTVTLSSLNHLTTPETRSDILSSSCIKSQRC